MTAKIVTARDYYRACFTSNINAEKVLCIPSENLKPGDRCYITNHIDVQGHCILTASKTESKQDAYNGQITDPNGIGVILSVTPYGDVWVRRINQAASALGSIRTPRKTQSSRQTVAAARAARSEPKSCNCGQSPHKSSCPVYQRQKQAESRARKQTT